MKRGHKGRYSNGTGKKNTTSGYAGDVPCGRSGFSRADWDTWDIWDRGGEVTSERNELAGIGDKEVSCMLLLSRFERLSEVKSQLLINSN